MTKELLSNVNLLKKYHNTIVYDYTEYPTKGHWSYDLNSQDYRAALQDWLPRSGGSPVLFYVHTPFCEQLCYFCLCSKEITGDYGKVENYLHNYLVKEVDMLHSVFEESGSFPNIEEIYFGGGSPTYYREPEFKLLVDKLRSIINFDCVKTFTVEIDPRRVTVDRLRFYHQMGVNRLSFGVQDFDPEVQKEINRSQPPELLEELLTPEIRSYFPVINFDLLIGLPKQTPATMSETIKRVVAIGPDEIQTMYVHYKPDVRKYMTRMVRNGPMPDFYDRKAIFLEATENLMTAGYARAGFESFSKPDGVLSSAMEKENALYNSLGTQSGDAPNFIAVGSSAHGCLDDDYYFQNFYEQKLYKNALDEGRFPIYRGYKLTFDDSLRRDVIKRIRTYFSLDFSSISDSYDIDFGKYFSKELDILNEFEKDGIVVKTQQGLVLSEMGKHFSPQVASVFDAYLGRQSYDASITS